MDSFLAFLVVLDAQLFHSTFVKNYEYDKFACFCKDMTAEKTDAINAGTDKSADLSALIEQLTNDRSEADDDINDLTVAFARFDPWVNRVMRSIDSINSILENV